MSGKRIWIFNLMLGALFVWGTLKLREDWTTFGATHGVTQVQGAPAAAEVSRAVQAPPAPMSAEGWTDIASRNPFSVDRNDNDIEIVEVAPPPVTTPKPILFGTLLLGNERLALLGKAGAGARSGQPVKAGEEFDGWKIVEIEDKTVVVSANGSREALVVGRVQIPRSSERTQSAVALPVPSEPTRTTAPAPSPATPNRPAAAPQGGRIVTPFETRE